MWRTRVQCAHDPMEAPQRFLDLYDAEATPNQVEYAFSSVIDEGLANVTAALMAPFAYLGPEWDAELTAAYTDPDAARLTEGQWGLLRRPSLYSDRSLRALVGKYVDSPLLRAIAVEHKAGRRLLVATTNLDAQEEVIWDMGAIALAGQAPGQAPAALALFRNVMVIIASLST